MSLLVKNGRIVTSTDDYVADIFCENETITAYRQNLIAPTTATVIDATRSNPVFPGPDRSPRAHLFALHGDVRER